jgi:parvulin-like peptidyl-prolyl isomerase
MYNKIFLSTICCLFFFTTHLSHAADPDKILVSAGTATLTQADFNRIIADMPPQLKKMLEERPELKTEMLQKWADFSILAQEAEATGFGDKETAQRKIKEIRDRVIVQELIESQMAKTTVTDQEISDYYNSHKDSYSVPEQVKAQHILIHIKDFNDAKAVELAHEKIKTVQEKLAAGESFATLASQYSDDTISKVKGGDVGFFPRGEMVPPFEDFAFSGKIGDISDPVKTKYGLHIIKITDKKEAGFSPLEKEKETIRMQLTEEKNRLRVEALLADLKKKYKIKIYE